MHFNYQKAFGLLIIILLLFFTTPANTAASNEKPYPFQAQYSLNNQKLDVSIPSSLYDYYDNQTHVVNGDIDYAKFVTPQALEPIAESIQNTTKNLPNSNEQFADAVLALVHQIPYVISDPKYPVETLVNNSGDCVTLSLLAASIMQAGGLDVVLIHYTEINPGHMNVGVYLPDTPVYHTPGLAPTDFVYNNKTYWTAEATPAENWKVGDQSDFLGKAEPAIIPLDNSEQSSPAQVSSSLDTLLLSSSITVNISQNQTSNNITQQLSIGDNTRALTISGSISPTYSGKSISIYVSTESSYDYFKAVTNDNGNYTFSWNFTSAGTYYIRTSWSGTSNYAGADSETLTVFVGPQSFEQFDASDYNYIYGQASIASYEVLPLQGVNSFLSIPIKTNVSISYDFTVLQAGHTVSNVPTKTVAIPARTQTVRTGRNNQLETIVVPAKTITTPVDVPIGLSPLRLPDDFNQTINDQFCFILKNSDGNYSLNINALNNYDISNLTQYNENNTAFMNATQNINENTLYHITESISDNSIASSLYNSNGTLIKNIETQCNPATNKETIMLITNNVDNAIVFKNLTIEALNSPIQTPTNNEKTITENGSLFPYAGLTILSVAIFSAALLFGMKKRQMKRKNHNNGLPRSTSSVNQVHY